MKTYSIYVKIICLGMTIAFLTNCTVYQPVQSGTGNIDPAKTLVLHKDGLRFILEDPVVQGDTIFAMVAPLEQEMGRRNQMIITLKHGQELGQSDNGLVQIPFAAIDHIEDYQKDVRKTRNSKIIGVTVSLAAGVAILAIIAAAAVQDSFENITFRIEDY